MSKLKNPLYSLSGKGTIGSEISFARRRGVNIAEKKPVPPDQQTLLQMYHRWLYEDYAYLWRQQTPAVQASYRSNGARCHLTGFQYWMSYQLTNLPDILLMSRFDLAAKDYSRHQNDGTIHGAVLTDGIIDKALHFDGVNDWVHYPWIPSYDQEYHFTVEFRFRIPDMLDSGGFFTHYGLFPNYGFWCDLWGPGSSIRFRAYAVPGAWKGAWCNVPIIPGHYHTYQATYDSIDMRLYFEGDKVQTINAPGRLDSTGNIGLAVGRYAVGAGGDWLDCDVDHLIYYDRVLDDTELKRHSLRRYPLD